VGYDVIKQNKIKHKGTTARGTEMGTRYRRYRRNGRWGSRLGRSVPLLALVNNNDPSSTRHLKHVQRAGVWTGLVLSNVPCSMLHAPCSILGCVDRDGRFAQIREREQR